MQNGIRRAVETFDGAVNQMFARLRQYLNGDIIRNMPAIDQFAQKIEIGIRSRRKTNLDFLESHADKNFEHAHLAGGVHWLDKRLITVT